MSKLLLITILLVGSTLIGCHQENENFDDFLFRFGSDEAFQRERIDFPLKVITWEDYEEKRGEIIETEVPNNEWQHDFLFVTESYRSQVYDNHKEKLRNSNERLFQWIGVENGVNVKYFFKAINGKWYLVKKEDLST